MSGTPVAPPLRRIHAKGDRLLNSDVLLYFYIYEYVGTFHTGELTGFVRVGPKGYFFPHKYKQEAANIYNMPLRESDIFVVTYPRSGTTLTQELTWLVINNLDYTGAAGTPLVKRYQFLEYSMFWHPKTIEQFKEQYAGDQDQINIINEISTPGTEHAAKIESTVRRFFKTHMPLSLLPPGLLDTTRVVYVARDPRDAAVSFYHLIRSIVVHNYVGDFKTYWNNFINNLDCWAPYFEHVKEAWEKRNHPNLLFLFYEEIIRDMPAAVRKVANFFGKEYSDEEVKKLCNHLHIDNFRHNLSVNFDFAKGINFFKESEEKFIRKGKSGGWRDYFDEEMMLQAQNWIEENLRSTDLRFPHFEIKQ